jgi:hypothetical protein
VAVLVEDLLTELARLPVHHDRVGSAADQHLEMGGAERLGEVVPGPGPERFDARGDAGIPGHHDHDGVAVLVERGPQQLETRDLRHVQIDQDDVELPPADHVPGLLAAPGQGHREPVHLQHAGTALPKGTLVVHQQNLDAGLDLRRDGERIPSASGVRKRGGSIWNCRRWTAHTHPALLRESAHIVVAMVQPLCCEICAHRA